MWRGKVGLGNKGQGSGVGFEVLKHGKCIGRRDARWPEARNWRDVVGRFVRSWGKAGGKEEGDTSEYKSEISNQGRRVWTRNNDT